MNEELERIDKQINAYLLRHWDNGGTSEFDGSINDLSRKRIKAFKKLHGTCFLYQVNKWKHEDPSCVEYTGQKIYNFDFTIITKERNEKIIAIIDERNRPKGKDEPYSGKRNMDEVNAIYTELERVKGLNLIWS